MVVNAPQKKRPGISAARVREIIHEELRRARLREFSEGPIGPDHEATAKLVGAASKLLKALAGFDDATKEMPAVATSTAVQTGALKTALGHMIEAPASYTKKPKEPKVVRLRPTADDGDDK
jgi:hypothetical protein